jgi:TBC1 domain family member 10
MKELESSFVPSEQSTRLSVATIDGAEGIGLSLLQNFMGSGGDDDSDASSDTDVAGYVRQGSPESTVDDHNLNYDSTPPQSADGHHPAPQPVSPSTSPTNRNSRISRISSHPSDYSDQGGEEWEGASDIYDNYRYSRFSVASRVSRFSRGSARAPPPVPLSAQHPSFDQVVPARRPAPLDLEARSPLLRTTFGSPLNSPGEYTTNYSTSAPPSPAGVATAIRNRLESERNHTITDAHLTPARGGEIVIPDDEEVPEVVPINDSSRPPSPTDAGNETFDSTTTSPQGAGDESIVTDETVLVIHPFPETQPLRLTRSPTSPPPQEARPAPPQPPVLAHPRPSKLPTFDFGSSRTSMFLPHPGAPKAPGTAPAGPLYGRVQSPPSFVPGPKHSQTSLTQLLRIAATTQTYPNGAPRSMTVYGICGADLASASGPVPVTFSLEPPISVPANRTIPHRSQSSDSNSAPPPSPQFSTPINQPFPSTSTGTGRNTGAIPRPNFFPQKPQIRPRSRSFSGFDSTSQKVGLSPGTLE